jgi:hypothetical protein
MDRVGHFFEDFRGPWRSAPGLCDFAPRAARTVLMEMKGPPPERKAALAPAALRAPLPLRYWHSPSLATETPSVFAWQLLP